MSDSIDWFEMEDEINSFTYQLNCMKNHNQGIATIRKNLIKNPIPIYQQAIDLYVSDLEMNELPPKDPESLWGLHLAPEAGDSIALAYEKALFKRKQKDIQHRYKLIKKYEDLLKSKIFQNVNWDDSKKESFLAKWKDNYFGTKKKPRKQKPGRWKQGQAIGRE